MKKNLPEKATLIYLEAKYKQAQQKEMLAFFAWKESKREMENLFYQLLEKGYKSC